MKKILLKSKNLDIDELFGRSDKKKESSHKTNVIIPKKVVFELDLDCKKATYKKVVTENLKGMITLTQHGIVMDDLKLKSANGLVKVNGRIFEEKNKQISIDGIFTFTNIDIKILFEQLDNLTGIP